MEELLPHISDDLDWHESGHTTRTPAEHTRYVGYEGQWYRLDLTTPHDLELVTALKRFLEAGQQVDFIPARRKPPVSGRSSAAYKRNQKILTFAKAKGLKFTERGRGNGSPYFPVATLRAFEEYEKQEAVAAAMEDSQ